MNRVGMSVCCALGFLRPAIDGNVVLFIFNANRQGTGKTLLLQLAVMIALGMDEGAMFPPTDQEEEMRKRITTALKCGLPVITIDNQEKRLNSQALSTLLTTRFWRDRFLGTNESASMPNNAVVTVTGNNVRVGDDQIRIMQDSDGAVSCTRSSFAACAAAEKARVIPG